MHIDFYKCDPITYICLQNNNLIMQWHGPKQLDIAVQATNTKKPYFPSNLFDNFFYTMIINNCQH